MARKSASGNNMTDKEMTELLPDSEKKEADSSNLNRMLASVLNYLSDDEVEEIDFESLLNNIEGLREWWDQYREKNRKKIEEEIKKSLGELPLKELENIREQIKDKKKDS